MKFYEVNWVRVFGVFLTAAGTGFLANASITGNTIQGIQAGTIVGVILGLVAIGNELTKDTTQIKESICSIRETKNPAKKQTKKIGVILSYMLPF